MIPTFPTRGVSILESAMIDVRQFDQFRQHVEAQGENFDRLVNGAAKHFASPVISRRTEPLTAAELQALWEDEMTSDQ